MSNTLTLIVMFALGAFVGAGLTIMITYATTARAINTISRTSRSAEKALHIAGEIIKESGCNYNECTNSMRGEPKGL